MELSLWRKGRTNLGLGQIGAGNTSEPLKRKRTATGEVYLLGYWLLLSLLP
jgi:hypothetical protein